MNIASDADRHSIAPPERRPKLTREKIIEALDRTASGSTDDDLWSWIMKDLLRLPLCYFLAVKESLSEGRWRAAKDPVAYIKTVASRKAVKMALDDDRELTYQTLNLPKDKKGGWVSLEKYVDYLSAGEYVRDANGERIDYGIRQDNSEDYVDKQGRPITRLENLMQAVPEELHRTISDEEKSFWNKINDEFEDDIYLAPQSGPDWEKIADAAGLDAEEKFVLCARAHGLTKTDLIRQKKTEAGKRRVEAAWKRLERHLEKIRNTLNSNQL